MKLCGLDFETANSCNGSICSVGVAVVENGEVLERKEYLIKPHKSLDWMSKFCRDIHGITYEDLRESPEFSEVWQSVKQLLISADCVVVHDAPFDLRHLHKVLEFYHLQSVSFDYVCSLQLCRHHFPELPLGSVFQCNLGHTFPCCVLPGLQVPSMARKRDVCSFFIVAKGKEK